MNWLEEIRKRYRIQQDMLACYLNIARTTLSMAEIGRRELPVGTIARLSPLLEESETILSGRFAGIFEAAEAKNASDLTKRTAMRQLELRAKLNRSQARLDMMQEKYNQALEALKLAQRISVLPENKKETERRQVLQGWLEASAAVWLEENGTAAQALLLENIYVYKLLLEAD